jgi:hypothetical protein
LEVLDFELKASHLPGRCAVTRVSRASSPFYSDCFGSCFMPKTESSYFMLSAKAEMTGTLHHAQIFPVEMGSYHLLAQAGHELLSF